MTSLLFCLLILWACYGFGASLLRRFGAETRGVYEEVPFATALGMGALSLLMLGIGLCGWLRPAAGIAAVLTLGALGGRDVLRLAGKLGAGARHLSPPHPRQLPLLVFFAASFTLTLAGALAPSGDMDYDGLVYHLTVPKLYLEAGRIYPLPWESHSNFPFGLEMLYLLGMLLRGWMKGQVLAKLFHFACGWLCALAIYSFGRRWHERRAGVLGAVIFLAIPMVSWELMIAYNELAFALYSFLAVYALAIWWEGGAERDGWLWVSAVMCGLALGIKMLAAATFLFCLLALGWALLRGAAHTRAWGRLAIFGLTAAVVGSPWYLKSYLWTGNPVYPFFYSLFGGSHWTAERAAAYAAAQREFGLGRDAWHFLLLPWNLTMHPQAFFDQPQQLNQFKVLIAVFGPLLLAYLPPLVALRPIGRAATLALWGALVYAACWFLLTQNSRYLLPILPGLCAAAGLAASRLLAGPLPVAAAVAAGLMLGSLSGLGSSLLLAAPAARVAIGLQSYSAYLGETSRVYSFCQAVNRATPPDANILVFGSQPQLFYLERRYLFGDHTEVLTRQDRSSPTALLKALRRLGVTHVLMPEAAVFSASPAASLELALRGLVATGALRPVAEYQGPMSLWVVANAK